MTDIPEELRQQLGGDKHRDPDRKYTTTDLVLSHIVNTPDGVTTNDLLVYLWEQTGRVISRAYVYRVLTILRTRGQIETINAQIPGLACNVSTALGRKEARPPKESSNATR